MTQIKANDLEGTMSRNVITAKVWVRGKKMIHSTSTETKFYPAMSKFPRTKDFGWKNELTLPYQRQGKYPQPIEWVE